jgi:hypothetical protein
VLPSGLDLSRMKRMGSSLAIRALSIILVGIILSGPLSPAASGLLVCIGDGTDPDCCRTSGSPQSGLSQLDQMMDEAACHCCITVDAIPSGPTASSKKASLDAFAAPAHLRNVALPTRSCVSRTANRAPNDERLSSLHTIVLLI